MRRAKRLTLLAIGLSVLALLALGALPQYLGGGDVYYMTATDLEGEERPAVDVSDADERRYPYMVEALETGRSEPYEAGRFGVKERFTHTPFDEMEAVRARAPEAAANEAVYVERNGTLYRVEITDAPE